MESLDSARDQFLDQLLHLDIQGGMAVIKTAVDAGFPAKSILLKVVSAAMETIGQMQANQVVTLAEVYIMSRIGDMAIERLMPMITDRPASAGTVILGSAFGDHHSLGRKIVGSFLRTASFRVIDLGRSVNSQLFIDTALAEQSHVICVSALLLHTAENIKEIRALLQTRGLEDQIKLIVGGAVFNFDDQLYKVVGADATARNAPGAVAAVRSMLKEVTVP
jgi:5-methyltetrahydrofolate--homocysteine methyltransferase